MKGSCTAMALSWGGLSGLHVQSTSSLQLLKQGYPFLVELLVPENEMMQIFGVITSLFGHHCFCHATFGRNPYPFDCFSVRF